jgi:hypothetical protein
MGFVDWIGLVLVQVMVSYEHGNKASGSTKSGKFL